MGRTQKSTMSSSLDFGFRKLKSIADTKPIYDNQIYKKDDNGKFKTNKILRLRCNNLEKLDGMEVQLSESITNFSAIQWLDLSFNEITSIGKNLEISIRYYNRFNIRSEQSQMSTCI